MKESKEALSANRVFIENLRNRAFILNLCHYHRGNIIGEIKWGYKMDIK